MYKDRAKETNSTQDLIAKMQNTVISEKEAVFNLYMPISKLTPASPIYKDFKKNDRKRIIETDYGTIEIRNTLLTEKDKKIIAAIIRYGEIRALPDGNLGSFFKEIDILRALNMGEKNYVSLRESIKKIMDALYYITINGITRSVRILDRQIYGEAGSKNVQGVVFNEEYVRMHRNDFSVSSKKLFGKITQIEYATIPSIINYIMTENKTKKVKVYQLKELLQKIGFPVENSTVFKKLKSNMLNFKEKFLNDYNIDYDSKKKTLSYSKPDEITIIEPLLDLETVLNGYINREFKYAGGNYIIKEIIRNGEKDWIIKTNINQLDFHHFLDDFIFFLDQTTEEKVIDVFFK